MLLYLYTELFFLMRLIKSRNGHDHPAILKQSLIRFDKCKGILEKKTNPLVVYRMLLFLNFYHFAYCLHLRKVKKTKLW